ncbi:MAG: YigZ family protein [Candidatus Peribacteria bacterium]|nr:YigZ family protein [Candidatus Peribacteria bacterium]
MEEKEKAEEHLESMRKKFYDATHHCYAWRIGLNVHQDLFGNFVIDPKFTRANDDGEPTNTAGKPILSVLEGKQLHNVLLVINRYFGGTLLGVGGLIQAYTQAAQETVRNAPLIQKEIFDELALTFTYEQTSLLTYLTEKYDAKVLESFYATEVKQKLQINRGLSEAFRKELYESSKGSLVC